MGHTSKTLDSSVALTRLMYALMPSICGLALARLGLVITTYGSYRSTDAGALTDGTTLVGLVMCVLIVFYFHHTRKLLNKQTVSRITNIAIIVQAVAILVFGLIVNAGNIAGPWFYVVGSFITCSSWLLEFFWLRRARNVTSAVAVALVFGALILSELTLYFFALLPQGLSCILIGFIVPLQFACRTEARKHPLPEEVRQDVVPLGYFGFAERAVDTVRLLGVLSIGIMLLSVVSGALRGFPDGNPILFTPGTRIMYLVVFTLYASFLIWRSFCGSRTIMTSTIWLTLEFWGMLGLLCYSALPESLAIGAIFTTVFNIGIVGLMWYLVIAFCSFGNLDTYYYAAAGFIVCLAMRALTRLGMLMWYPNSANSTFEELLLAAVILVSTQIVLTQLIWLEGRADQDEKRIKAGVKSLLGLDNVEPVDTEVVRQVLMENQIARVQEEFQLTARETEILTMYALGKTQKIIAEELFLSTGTVHSHIKNIYAKTDLHSRQEVLDYLAKRS